jgi:hypothetical protein
MNFQNTDQNLISYNKFFDDSKSAFVPKPTELLYVPVEVPSPKKIDKALLFSSKQTLNIGDLQLDV